jgi:hypothetical protein
VLAPPPAIGCFGRRPARPTLTRSRIVLPAKVQEQCRVSTNSDVLHVAPHSHGSQTLPRLRAAVQGEAWRSTIWVPPPALRASSPATPLLPILQLRAQLRTI